MYQVKWRAIYTRYVWTNIDTKASRFEKQFSDGGLSTGCLAFGKSPNRAPILLKRFSKCVGGHGFQRFK